MKEIPFGYCRCGCGGKTPIAKNNHSTHGWIKGQPIKFIFKHNSRGQCNPRWNGGKRKRSDGYMYIWKPDHPRAAKNYVMEHILVAEKALGKLLPDKVEIHHINEIRYENFNKNLVLCENLAYHKFLHVRLRALKACGHALWKKCIHCKVWDDPKNMSINAQKTAYHLSCVRKDCKRRRLLKKLANTKTYTEPVSRFVGEMGG